MALNKMNKAIGEMIKEVETLTISKIKDILVEKLTEEYEPEFVQAVEKVLSDIKFPSYSENIKKPAAKSSDREKKKREPTEYNLFLKEKMAEIKEAGTELKGKDLMKAAIVEWNKKKAANAEENKNSDAISETDDNKTDNEEQLPVPAVKPKGKSKK